MLPQSEGAESLRAGRCRPSTERRGGSAELAADVQKLLAALLANRCSVEIVQFGEGLVGQCAMDKRRRLVADIPADEVTHVNYAFANISPQLLITHGDSYADVDRFYPGDSWEAGALRGSFHQLIKLKQLFKF